LRRIWLANDANSGEDADLRWAVTLGTAWYGKEGKLSY